MREEDNKQQPFNRAVDATRRKQTFLAAGLSELAATSSSSPSASLFLVARGFRGARLGASGSSFFGCAAMRDDRLVSVDASAILISSFQAASR